LTEDIGERKEERQKGGWSIRWLPARPTVVTAPWYRPLGHHYSQGLQFFEDSITHRLSTFFCNLSTFTVRQNHCVTQVSCGDISVGVWPGYGRERRGIVVWFQAGARNFPFSKGPDRLWGPPTLLFNWYPGLFLRL